jgi:amidophosphoribosyltransferase
VVDYAKGSVAVAHNGNLVNARKVREELESEGAIFTSTMDSEIVVHLLAQSSESSFIDSLIDSLNRIQGAYSLLLMTEDMMVGLRDPRGFRPLCIGRIGDGYVLSSETCALDLIGAKFLREVEPGEIVVIDKNGMRSLKPFLPVKETFCVFEYIYFARPDSDFSGKNVALMRRKLGRVLAKEAPVGADVVVPVPDSGIYAAMGYSEESKIPFDRGLIRNHYVGRTFIEPRQSIRHFGVKIKLNPVRRIVRDKRVVVVDDSIVRGTTSRKIIKMIRDAGAKEVHMRISAPPSKFSCLYGIDTPTRKELIAASHSLEEIKAFLETDSLGYLSIEGMARAITDNNDICKACFSGEYPIKSRWKKRKQLRLFERVVERNTL